MVRQINPKVIYHPQLEARLIDYGIEIPLKLSRVQKVYETLRAAGHESFLIIPKIENLPILEADLLEQVHDQDFIKRLMENGEGPEREMEKAYELKNDQGDYNRYNPKSAKFNLTHLRDSILRHARGTLWAAEQTLDNQFCFFLGGGMHHAMSFGGRGFCPINDIVLAITYLKNKKLIQQAWVIDTDAHKGDGTAELAEHRRDLLTLSIHMKNGWPLDGPRFDSKGQLHPWFIPSNIDIGIAKGHENAYLPRLVDGLNALAAIEKPLPELAIVVAGADPYEGDELPSSARLNLSKEDMLKRDQLVFNFLKEKGIPQLWVMGGGYGDSTWEIYEQFLNWVITSHGAGSAS